MCGGGYHAQRLRLTVHQIDRAKYQRELWRSCICIRLHHLTGFNPGLGISRRAPELVLLQHLLTIWTQSFIRNFQYISRLPDSYLPHLERATIVRSPRRQSLGEQSTPSNPSHLLVPLKRSSHPKVGPSVRWQYLSLELQGAAEDWRRCGATEACEGLPLGFSRRLSLPDIGVDALLDSLKQLHKAGSYHYSLDPNSSPVLVFYSHSKFPLLFFIPSQSINLSTPNPVLGTRRLPTSEVGKSGQRPGSALAP